MSSILIWSPNYEPELTGIPPLVTDAAVWLTESGHRVDVVTAFPNYPERRIHDGYHGLWCHERRGPVAVHRSWLRVRPVERFTDKLLYELSFSTLSLRDAGRFARGCDTLLCVVPTLTTAFYAGLLARALGHRFRLVLWIQDLVLAAAQSLRPGGGAQQLLRAARLLEAAAYRAADRIVVCSPGFEDHLVACGVDPGRVQHVLNWVDVDWIVPQPRAANGGVTRFLYAGNLGYTQGFEILAHAARLTGNQVAVEIAGAGNAAAEVARLCRISPTLSVRAPVPRAEFPSLLASADVHLVLQKKGAAGANLPSKIASYLASGRPVLGSLDPDTAAASLLRESGGAVLVPPENPEALAAAMLDLHARSDLRETLGRNGRAFAVRRLNRLRSLKLLEGALLG